MPTTYASLGGFLAKAAILVAMPMSHPPSNHRGNADEGECSQ